MPTTQEKPADEKTSPVVSPKRAADPEDFAFHHPEIQHTVDQYEELVEVTVEATVEAAGAKNDRDDDAYRRQFIPYCG